MTSSFRKSRIALCAALVLVLTASERPMGQTVASYTLSGSPDGTATFHVDDNLDVYLNGALVYSDNVPPGTPGTRAPIVFNAAVGDTLRFVVRDTHGVCSGLGTLFLTDAAGRSVVADPGFDIGCGRPNADLGVTHDSYFVIPDLSVTPGPPIAEFVGEIRPGPAGSGPRDFAVFQNALYFNAEDDVNGDELWRVGTTGPPELVADLLPGAASSDPRDLTVAGDRLYFVATSASDGEELWHYDGVNPPSVAADINPGTASSFITEMTSLGNEVVFQADGGTGAELLVFGSAGGLRQFDIWEDDPSCDPSGGGCGSYPYELTVYRGVVYFGAADEIFGTELHQYDGTTVTRLTDIMPGLTSSDPTSMTGVGNRLVFSAMAGLATELYAFDIDTPGAAPTRLTTGTTGGFEGAQPSTFTSFNGRAYFQANDNDVGRELWSTDGTQAGTFLLADINPGPEGSGSAGTYGVFNGELYFTAFDASVGAELRATNGVSVRLVADSNPGPANSSQHNPTPLGPFLVLSLDFPNPAHPGFTTGTAIQVVRKADGTLINPTGDSVDDAEFAAFNGDLYFSASDGVRGSELWRITLEGASTPSATTTLTSSPNPSTVGETVTLTATVTGQGALIGSITFQDGAVALAPPIPLSGGMASFSTTSLAAGTHLLTASYSGDVNNGPGVSSPATHIVNRVLPAVGLLSSSNPSTFGGSVTFTATLNADATGTVSFLDNGVSLGSSALAGGQASLTLSTLAVGVHPVVARYGGNATYLPADSATLNQTVIASNGAPVIFPIGDRTIRWGELIDFAISANDPDGDAVTFSLVNPPAGAAITPGGRFTWTPTSAQTGTYLVTVEASDGALAGTRSFTVVVQPHTTFVSIPGPFVGSPGGIELLAALRDGVDGSTLPGRTLLFELGTQSITAVTDAMGLARGTLQLAQTGGQKTYTVSYAGEPAYAASSASATFLVNLAPVFAPVAPQPIPWGRTLSVAVQASDPDGDPVTVTLVSGPAGVQFSGGLLSWTPTAAQVGVATVTLRAADGFVATMLPVALTVLPHATQVIDLEPAGGSDRIFPRASLIDTEFGVPLNGRTITFVVGTQQTAAATDAFGVARGSLVVNQPSSMTTLAASFAGAPDYAPASASRSFQLVGPVTSDADGDALPDDWEINGVDIDGDGTIDLDLPAMGANPLRKDLFIETDWMVRPPTCIGLACFDERSFQPQAAALDILIAAFAGAPVLNPDGSSGITLHIDAGPLSLMDPMTGQTWGTRSRATVVPYQAALGASVGFFGYDWTAFDLIKQSSFETARRGVFRYGLYVDTIAVSNIWGMARDVGSTDVIIVGGAPSLGAGGMTARVEAHTVMHEIGHLIGLGHGGGDMLNFKPNYTSIMNYAFPLGLPPDWREDFSRVAEPAVDETITGDRNGDGLLSVLEGFDDWANLAFTGGGIGGLLAMPVPAHSPILDPDRLGIGTLARDGDGVVVFRGPSFLVRNAGVRVLAVDVANVSSTDAQYVVSLEGGFVAAPLSTSVSVSANQVLRVTFDIDTTGLAPGEYAFTLALRDGAGAVLHSSAPRVSILDLGDPVTADLARQTAAALAQLPPDSGFDPAVVQSAIDMINDTLATWEAVVVVTGRTAFSARYEIAEPHIGRSPGVILADEVPGAPEFELRLIRVGSLASGRVRMRASSGQMFEAAVAGRWHAASRTFDGRWTTLRQSGAITIQLKAP